MSEMLPIEPLLPEIRQRLSSSSSLVLEAPPGAGKTTRVPLALLDEPWLRGQRILMLEPRRLAARAAANRMASLLGENPGGTVGYRTRLDSKVGPATRLEVVTEGILTRRIQADPGLEGVGLLIFDEFHERSLQADLGLALALEVQALREDLRILVMSATLDGAAIARLMGDAARVTSEGRGFPVEVHHLGPPKGRLEQAVASAVRRALHEATGDILVFLPGEAEIRRTAQVLEQDDFERLLIAPLYGALSSSQQDVALRPAPPGLRKVVLASAVAETSLTIEGIEVVIDSGLSRRARFDPTSGMTRLETGPVSRASADQRRGRAGRTSPGLCYRLWHEAQERALPAFDRPEILDADLAPLALELAAWGTVDPRQLAWLDPPPAGALAQARDLLQRLRALDPEGRITEHGRKMVRLGAHPRLGHMLLSAKGEDRLLACDIAALLSERDLLRGKRDADLRLRLDLLRFPETADQNINRATLKACKRLSSQWQSRLKVRAAAANSQRAGRLLALAYPERLAQRRGDRAGSFRLASGRGAFLPTEDPLAAEDWLAVAALDGSESEARIFLAAPITREEILETFGERVSQHEKIAWDHREERLTAVRESRLDYLVLGQTQIARPEPEAVIEALVQVIEKRGLAYLRWDDAARQLQARVALLRRLDGPLAWPDWSDRELIGELRVWLAPHLAGISRLNDLQRLDLAEILLSQLDWAARARLDREAPTHLRVPSGNRYRLDYTQGEEPVLAVKLQEMFGARESPRVASGRIPVLLHLLSPAGRPLQVTRDLSTFWSRGYREVRAEMRGRYPKHPWPEDPLTAVATARTKSRA